MISQNGGNTKQDDGSETEMIAQAHENPSKCLAQNAKAKSPRARLVARIARLSAVGWMDIAGNELIRRRVQPIGIKITSSIG